MLATVVGEALLTCATEHLVALEHYGAATALSLLWDGEFALAQGHLACCTRTLSQSQARPIDLLIGHAPQNQKSSSSRHPPTLPQPLPRNSSLIQQGVVGNHLLSTTRRGFENPLS